MRSSARTHTPYQYRYKLMSSLSVMKRGRFIYTLDWKSDELNIFQLINYENFYLEVKRKRLYVRLNFQIKLRWFISKKSIWMHSYFWRIYRCIFMIFIKTIAKHMINVLRLCCWRFCSDFILFHAINFYYLIAHVLRGICILMLAAIFFSFIYSTCMYNQLLNYISRLVYFICSFASFYFT